MGKIANFSGRRRDWGLKRALHWEIMHTLELLGVSVNYVRVGGDMREILGETRPEVPPGYDTRMVGLAELLPYVGEETGLTREFLEAAFARGDRCTANFFGERLVGFSFNCYTRARVNDQIDVIIPEGFRYGYKAWTHPEHRRARLSKMRGYVRRRTLPFDIDCRSISYVATHNYPSLLHGYRHPRVRGLAMGLCGWVTVFGRKIPFNSRRAKWVGFEFVRREDAGRRQYTY